MCDKLMVSLEQVQSAIAAMIADYNRNPDRRKVDKAPVDDAGNLSAYTRMDRCLRPTFAYERPIHLQSADLILSHLLSDWQVKLDQFNLSVILN